MIAHQPPVQRSPRWLILILHNEMRERDSTAAVGRHTNTLKNHLIPLRFIPKSTYVFCLLFPPLPLHDKNSSRHPPLTIPNTIASPSCIKSSRSERKTRGGRWVSAQSKFDIYNRFTFHLVPYYASSLSLSCIRKLYFILIANEIYAHVLSHESMISNNTRNNSWNLFRQKNQREKRTN